MKKELVFYSEKEWKIVNRLLCCIWPVGIEWRRRRCKMLLNKSEFRESVNLYPSIHPSTFAHLRKINNLFFFLHFLSSFRTSKPGRRRSWFSGAPAAAAPLWRRPPPTKIARATEAAKSKAELKENLPKQRKREKESQTDRDGRCIKMGRQRNSNKTMSKSASLRRRNTHSLHCPARLTYARMYVGTNAWPTSHNRKIRENSFSPRFKSFKNSKNEKSSARRTKHKSLNKYMKQLFPDKRKNEEVSHSRHWEFEAEEFFPPVS